jgi:hypothetical protein
MLRFLDLYHAGRAGPDEIDKYIAMWHRADQQVQLHVFLGLTWLEYRTWLTEGWLPTAQEHAAERVDAVWLGLDDEQAHLLRVHPPQRCRPPCPIHWPSDHLLAGAPMCWNEGAGFLSRTCRHQIPHPDPDDQQVRLHEELREHPCDGCCRPHTFLEGEFYEDDEPVAEVVHAFDTAAHRGITRRPR